MKTKHVAKPKPKSQTALEGLRRAQSDGTLSGADRVICIAKDSITDAIERLQRLTLQYAEFFTEEERQKLGIVIEALHEPVEILTQARVIFDGIAQAKTLPIPNLF
jgi:hypothetical protein